MGATRRPRLRYPPTVVPLAAVAVLVVLLFLLSSTANAIAYLSPTRESLARSSEVSPARDAVNGPVGHAVLSSCPLAGAIGPEVYDPTNSYLYIGAFYPQGVPGSLVYIVKPPCGVIATVNITGGIGLSGMAYDPLTREVVVGPTVESTIAYVIEGTVLVANITLLPFGPTCFEGSPTVWDPAADAVLIGICAGVTLLRLAIVDGVTTMRVIPNAFAVGDYPTALLVADGYIFAASETVLVFNDRSLAYIGSFPRQAIDGGFCTSLAWDPLLDSVVVGVCIGNPVIGPVVFLGANGIGSGHYTVSRLKAPGILNGGVGDVAYSPTQRGKST